MCQATNSTKPRGGGFLLLVLGLCLLLAGSAFAQKRGGSARARSAKAAAARRQMEIDRTQKQLDAAQKVLESVSTQGALTQAQLDAARQNALAARRELNEAEVADKAIHEKLHSIEEGILEAQSDDSEYAKALDDVDTARRAADTELHRVLRRPAPAVDEEESTRLSELALLTPDEREKLTKSSSYQEKKVALQVAVDHMNATRLKLFQDNAEWKQAREEHHKAEQEKAKDERSVQAAANDSSDARGELRSAAQIAASARATIAQAEAKLRALGAKPGAAKNDKKPSTGKTGK